MTHADELIQLIESLESLADDRSLLQQLGAEHRERLIRAAGRVAHPGRAARRQLLRAQRAQRQQAVKALKERDEAELEATGIRRQTATQQFAGHPPQPSELRLPPNAKSADQNCIAKLRVPKNCYICKRDYDRVHFFYDALCPDCAEFNYDKRNQRADLNGRTALLTGGRVKIGFEVALKLLRCGADVIVTTRFPRDAARRFAAQNDAAQWLERLQVYGLDLRHAPSVEAFAEHLLHTAPRLDFILNNACQTVRRPSGFYAHLMAGERQAFERLSPPEQRVLHAYQEFAADARGADGTLQGPVPRMQQPLASNTPYTSAGAVSACAVSACEVPACEVPACEVPACEVPPAEAPFADPFTPAAQLVGLSRAAELSQLLLHADDAGCGREVFPQDHYDGDAQQIDLRDRNSWRLKLAQISTVEMLEVQLVNCIAPFLLNARLKPLMVRTAGHEKHIVNVSAMEGVFYRAFKRDTHPHTNMAKAALNMMTRTSAADYIRDGIHMNSVDTGWITDEDPVEIAHRKQQELGFRTPLDCTDAAARICDPILSGLNTGQHIWGKFLKDYQVSNW